jgi:Flp pilus assembly protein TadD
LRPFVTLADLIDAQRMLLNGQFSDALEFAHDIADTHPVDAALISAHALIEFGNPKEAESYAAFAVRVAPKSFSARLLMATAQRHSTSKFSLPRSLGLGSDKGIIK